jgi:hypothetical protein
MKKTMYQIPSRIPKLYYGTSTPPRSTSTRARLADALYVFLLIVSYTLFAVGGGVGYLVRQVYGLVLFTLLGYVAGMWIRRSLGLRGRKTTTGFFMRMRERAQGSRPGVLEWVLEKISGQVYTQAQCKAVVQAHEKAVKVLRQAKTMGEKNRILAELDQKVNKLLLK